MNFIFENLINSPALQILISAIISFGITWYGIPVIINICNLKKLMDNPIKRSSHEFPTPTFGGVAIYSSVLISYLIWNFKDEGHLMHKVLACLTILFFLGLKDDLFALDALKKLASQILVALIVVVGSDLRITSFFGIFGVYQIPYMASAFFTVFLIVALINSFNLIDGIDGLSGGIGMIAAAGFGLWFSLNAQWSLACLSFALVGSLLAFLRYNFSHENKIFMGDTGSLVIGFLVAILAIQYVQLNVFSFSFGNMYKSAPVLAIVLLIIPIFDTIRVFSIRIGNKKSPFKADRSHLHHLMVDNGLSHVATSFIMYFITISLSAAYYFLRSFFTNTQLSFSLLGVLAFYFLGCNMLEKRRLKNHRSRLSNTYIGEGETLELTNVIKSNSDSEKLN
jgi:UDP-GlcNAc:undecaprenyl-phosphate/decaprenyl-phosphate GlcNAc-1-phosphate transferase